MSSLYLDHFGLNKPPFQITPDLDFFFSGGQRGDVLTALRHVAAHEEGIVTVIAEVGCGKTLLARLMISRLDPGISTVYLANPSFSRDEILGAIGRDLGLTDLAQSTEGRLAALQQELLRRHAAGERVLLVIDEAHAMPPESLEEVRLLSNLETGQHKLLNIMLFGQPELEELLADRRMRQVRDRIVHRFKLLPLPAQEAPTYVDHRLRSAGWQGGMLFSAQAMALLVQAAGGRVRRINLLADKSLLAAFAQGVSSVELRHVQEAVAELHENFTMPSDKSRPIWQKWAPVAVLSFVILGALAYWVLHSNAGSANGFASRVAKTASVVIPVDEPAAVQQAPVAAPAPAAAVVRQAVAPVVRPPSVMAQVVPPVAVSIAPTVPPRPIPELSTRVQPAPAVAAAPASSRGKPSASRAQEPDYVPDDFALPYFQRTEAYLQQPALGGYTVQLAVSSRRGAVAQHIKFIAQHLDSAEIYADLSHYNGRKYVSIYAGRFETAADARAALAKWPDAIKADKPIIRTWAKIRQDQLS